MVPESFRCYLVKKLGKNSIETTLEQRPTFELPGGEVTIRVACSSLNYKDALAATGHPGVVRRFPHVPGIDAAGTVLASESADVRPGDEVLVTSYELGVERWGGWSELIRVPAAWVLPLPAGLSLEESMILGTAGLTAGLCLRALQQHDVLPDRGEVVVTGATGGVGSLAVALLARLGYTVVAVSGKVERRDWLASLGATRIIDRNEILDDSGKPLLPGAYAGAIDTVGGSMLGSLLRRIGNDGCIACCGLVGGAELATTVYPFILRGVTLAGIDSAWCSRARRQEVWQQLAGPWKPRDLNSHAQRVPLSQVRERVPEILAGHLTGRVVVDVDH